MWVFISLYQGCMIQLLSQRFQTLLDKRFTAMVALSFSCLIYNELIMVAISINKWNKIMASTIILTFLHILGQFRFYWNISILHMSAHSVIFGKLVYC